MHYQSTCMSYWSKDLQINVRTRLCQGLYVRLPKTVQIIQNTIINNISCTSTCTFLSSVDMLQLRGAILNNAVETLVARWHCVRTCSQICTP